MAPAITVADPTRVNLNTATAEQLEALPGIGPDLAQRILDYRTDHGPYKTIDGLLKVKGIGEGKLAKFRNMVTVDSSATPTDDAVATAN